MRRLIVAMRRTQPTTSNAASAAIRRRHKSTDHFDAAATEKKIGELQRCVRDHLARQDVAEAVAAGDTAGGGVLTHRDWKMLIGIPKTLMVCNGRF